MTDLSIPTPSLAHDSRALPWTALTSEEKKIIKKINACLRAIQEENNGKRPPIRWGTKDDNEYYPWAFPERDRTSRVLMLDGSRGVGKTSLLVTMIDGWLKPNAVDSDCYKKTFKDMDKTVKPLTPLDFDPLPPELPLYSWIIQAFEPLVEKVGGPSRDEDFFDDTIDDYPRDTVRDKFRKLQNSAAVGWTAGLLKYQLAKDLGEFLLWQGEQQMNWQNLQRDWQDFLDKLFRDLERSDPALTKGAVIALPIDDLDLQAHRLRELLLALRVLRHERVVYVLTGDMDNMDLCLEVEFYRSYLQKEAFVAEGLGDKVREEATKLARALREKVVPDAHRYKLDGLRLADPNAMEWSPGAGRCLGDILDTLRPDLGIRKFLKECRTIEDTWSIPFRPLQGFFDRWKECQTTNLGGVVDFLKIVVGGSAADEPMMVSQKGSRIELAGTDLAVYAPAPRDSGTLVLEESYVTLHWMRDVDFARMLITPDEEPNMSPAPPEILLALDFVAWNRNVFQIINGPQPTTHTLGLVWTQIDGTNGRVILPWPTPRPPGSPNDWKKKVELWNNHLKSYGQGDELNGEAVLKAWCSFIADPSPEPDTTLENHLKQVSKDSRDVLLLLATALSGLPDKVRRTIARVHNVKKEQATDLEDRSLRRAYWWKIDLRFPVDPYRLAFIPLAPKTQDTDEIKEIKLVRDALKSRLKPLDELLES